MKNKKTMSVLVMLLAVLLLGVGYALSSIDLKVTASATATADQDDFDVIISDAVNNTDPSEKVVVQVGGEGSTAATMTVNLNSGNRSGKATFTILNNSSDLKAELDRLAYKIISGDADSDYFTVTISDLSSTTLAPQATATFTATIDLAKVPVEDKSVVIEIPITATAAEL